MWRDFGRAHLVKKILEQGAKICANSHDRFLDSNTLAHEWLSKTSTLAKFSLREHIKQEWVQF
jgi:hypothetical protein